MNVRGLALVAIVLGGLLAAVVLVGLDRMGHLQVWDLPEWKFENHLLKVPPGSYVIVRSVNPDAIQARFMFERTVTEPTVNRDRAPKPTDPPSLPYILLFVETKRPGDRDWRFTTLNFAALAQMGARTTREWLEELGPVRETLPDGSQKIMLRARYGQENGSQVLYFYDPNDPEASSRGFGWSRMEAYGGEDMSEITFTIPDGRLDPGR